MSVTGAWVPWLWRQAVYVLTEAVRRHENIHAWTYLLWLMWLSSDPAPAVSSQWLQLSLPYSFILCVLKISASLSSLLNRLGLPGLYLIPVPSNVRSCPSARDPPLAFQRALVRDHCPYTWCLRHLSHGLPRPLAFPFSPQRWHFWMEGWLAWATPATLNATAGTANSFL